MPSFLIEEKQNLLSFFSRRKKSWFFAEYFVFFCQSKQYFTVCFFFRSIIVTNECFIMISLIFHSNTLYSETKRRCLAIEIKKKKREERENSRKEVDIL